MSDCLGEDGQPAGITKRNEETWVWGDEHFQSLDCGNNFTGVYICQI